MQQRRSTGSCDTFRKSRYSSRFVNFCRCRCCHIGRRSNCHGSNFLYVLHTWQIVSVPKSGCPFYARTPHLKFSWIYVAPRSSWLVRAGLCVMPRVTAVFRRLSDSSSSSPPASREQRLAGLLWTASAASDLRVHTGSPYGIACCVTGVCRLLRGSSLLTQRRGSWLASGPACSVLSCCRKQCSL